MVIQPWKRTFGLMSLATLAVLAPSCSDDELRNELRQANGELRQENRELREKVATLDKQLAQLMGRFDEAQRASDKGSQKATGNQILAQAEAQLRSDMDDRMRKDQFKPQAVATVGKIAAQMDRLLEEIPNLENSSLIAWDASMPKLSSLYKNAALQMNSLAAELDGAKFERSEEVKLKIAGFTNGYQSLPGIGRMVLGSRERAAALRAAPDPSKPDSDPGVSEEVNMTTQLSVFNATLFACKKIQGEVAKLAN